MNLDLKYAVHRRYFPGDFGGKRRHVVHIVQSAYKCLPISAEPTVFLLWCDTHYSANSVECVNTATAKHCMVALEVIALQTWQANLDSPGVPL